MIKKKFKKKKKLEKMPAALVLQAFRHKIHFLALMSKFGLSIEFGVPLWHGRHIWPHDDHLEYLGKTLSENRIWTDLFINQH